MNVFKWIFYPVSLECKKKKKKKVVFYTNITLPWWLLFFDQTCTYSDSHVSVLKPYRKIYMLSKCLGFWWSVCLFIKKLSEIVKRRHTQQILQTCHSPEAM